MMRKLALLGASLLTLAAQPLYAQQGAAPEPASAPAATTAAQDDATGSAQTGPQRRFTGEDLFGLAAASDPQISPDGRHIAYVRRANDIMSDRAVSTIWLIDTQTGAEVPVAGRSGDAFSPRWSPDGKRLAYASTEGGSVQLWVRWMDGGEAVKLTGLPTTDVIRYGADPLAAALPLAVPPLAGVGGRS